MENPEEYKLKYTGAMVLGMHDAIVSLTGTIVGLTSALNNNRLIILGSVIATIAASLSMAASNYLAHKTIDNPKALITGLYTGLAYVITSALLILPFALCPNRLGAMMLTFLTAVAIIFGFNFCTGHIHHRPWVRRFWEMLIICTTVSVVAYVIGSLAKYFLGIDV